MTEREIVLAMWADIARRRAESQGVISGRDERRADDDRQEP